MRVNFSEKYWSLLALLRFVLSNIVFIYHLYYFGPQDKTQLGIRNLGGVTAVICFLFLSGLSIGYSFANSPKEFIKRRLIRIYPLYFFAVLFAVILQATISPVQGYRIIYIPAGLLTSVANTFMLQGIVAIPMTFNSPLWSLSVEFTFYILTPLICKIPNYLLNIIIGISLVIFLLTYPNIDTLYGLRIVQFSWAWIIGFAFSQNKKHPILQVTFFFSCFIIGVYHLVAIKEESLAYITLGMLILVFTSYKLPLKLSEKQKNIFNFLGNLSYPLYVFHWPMALLLYHIGIRGTWNFYFIILLSMPPIYYFFDVYLKRLFWKPTFNYLFNIDLKKNILHVD